MAARQIGRALGMHRAIAIAARAAAVPIAPARYSLQAESAFAADVTGRVSSASETAAAKKKMVSGAATLAVLDPFLGIPIATPEPSRGGIGSNVLDLPIMERIVEDPSADSSMDLPPSAISDEADSGLWAMNRNAREGKVRPCKHKRRTVVLSIFLPGSASCVHHTAAQSHIFPLSAPCRLRITASGPVQMSAESARHGRGRVTTGTCPRKPPRAWISELF